MITKSFIYYTIRDNVIKTSGCVNWSIRCTTILDMLNRYLPDKPDDGTSGFLAYNVGDDKPRMKIKTGRFLTKKLGLNNDYLNDQTVQKIASIINTTLFGDDKSDIELVNGPRITENYCNEVGGGSCMTDNDGDFTRMYENNPNRFRQLIIKNCNNSARAIVHKLDNGKFLMDRVYSDDSVLDDKMVEYAISREWFYREHNQAANYDIAFNHIKVEDYSQFVVSDLNWNDGEVPYQDTLINYCITSGGLITISHDKSGCRYDSTIDITNGCLEERYCCDDCNESISEDDCHCIGDRTVCRWCVEQNYSYCEDCGEYYNNDSIVCIGNTDKYICEDCASDKYYQCSNCHDYFTELTETNDNEDLCETCLIDEYTSCDDCGEWFVSDDINDDGFCFGCQEDSIPKQNENDTAKLPFEESICNAE